MKRIFTLIIFIFLLNSCNSPFGKVPGLTVFRYNEFSNITSLDPAFAKDQANIWACNQLYNGLLQMDNRLNIIPCIAKQWEIDSTGTVYTFKLRDDVFFHDHPLFPGGKGRRVVAGDFVYSFNRILDPGVASPGAWVFSKVAMTKMGFGFSAPNDSTFIVELSEPFPPFAGILSMIYCCVVPHEIVNALKDDFRKNPAGTGPFCLQAWKENVKLVLTKNPGYFEIENGQRLPYLDGVAVTFLYDKQTAFLEFVKGNLDFISGLDQSYKDELLTKDGQLRKKYTGRFNMMTEPYLNTEYIGILLDTTLEIVKESPLRDIRVRKAINYGFDREKMIKYIRNNIGVPGRNGIIPPGLPAYDSSAIAYTFDQSMARQLLKEAGYGGSREFPAITLHTTAEYVDIFKYFQGQMEEIGIPVKIEIDPAATLIQMKAHSKVNFFRASWIADYPDEENYLALFAGKNLAPGGPNYSRFQNPEYDSLYELSQRIIGIEERQDVYRRLNRIIMDEAPVIVLYYDQVVRFSQKNIINLGTNPLNLLSLKHVKKLREN